MTRQVWAREHLVGYLAGGLTAEERFEIQELLKSDAELAAALDELRGLDDRMRKLFVAAKPPMMLEDRVIQALRRTTAPKPRAGAAQNAKWWMIAASFLVIVLAGASGMALVGTALEAPLFIRQIPMTAKGQLELDLPKILVSGDDLFEGAERWHDESPDVAARTARITKENGDRSYFGVLKVKEGDERSMAQELLEGRATSGLGMGTMANGVFGLTPAGQLAPDSNAPIKRRILDSAEKQNIYSYGETRHGANVQLESKVAGGDGRSKADQPSEPQSSSFKIGIRKADGELRERNAHGYRFIVPNADNKEKDESRRAALDKLMDAKAGDSVSGATMDQLGSVIVRGVDPANVNAVKKTIEGLEKGPKAGGDGFALGFINPPTGGLPGGGSGSAPTTWNAPERTEAGDNGRPANGVLIYNDLTKNMDMGAVADGKSKGDGVKTADDSAFKPADAFKRNLKAASESGIVSRQEDQQSPESEKARESNKDDPAKQPLGDPSSERNSQPKESIADLQDKDTKKVELPKDSPPAKVETKNSAQAPDQLRQPEDKQAAVKLPEPKQQLQKRIIIRSGDIDFEVDSFDQAVGIIYNLIAKTKGGVVATTNSDKLANGKMRGTVVVRMPPEELDDFVAAMRTGLGKFGELTGQRIGSQDVTKHYTDMESELRGLRVSEERLIVMLKDSKAQLKDLLAVETQLAKTRTSLEKIEGELRYYANLAAMSTLTINLNEKEIRLASGVVESERVQAGVESEDVDKAFQDTKAAIDELKGRVFKSELKQFAAGQFNAILQFDIAPESAGLMRDRLKQIGVVARLEIDRVQKVTGGGAATRESKIKRGDTQFMVSIYNLANVAPRETVNATIVGADVPASYVKIRSLVAKLKGNLRNTSMQNTDVRNIAAVLDFDIRRVDEPAVQAALAEAGEFLGRRIDRSAESENVTDTKVRFALRLISVGSIQARETNNLAIAAVDVPASYRKVRDAVVKAKGYMRNANLEELDKSNVKATLDFDVMRSEEPALLTALAEAGEILGRRVERAAESDNVTDARVRFAVRLLSVSSIQARESNNLALAAVDVPASYRKVRDAVAKAKGHMRNANLQETDKSNISATLDFDVLRNDEAALLAAIADAGEILTRRLDRRPEGESVTDAKIGFSVTMQSVAAIPARETTILTIAATDVPAAFAKLREAASKAKAQIRAANLQENDRENMTAVLDFDVLRADEDTMLTALAAAGEQLKRQVDRQASGANVTDAKVLFKVQLESASAIPPRDLFELHIKVDNVEDKLKAFRASVHEAQGRIVDGPKKGRLPNGKMVARVTYHVPLIAAPGISESFKNAGRVEGQNEAKNTKAPEGKLALAEFVLKIYDTEPIVPNDEGFLTQLRNGASVSLRGLSMTVSFLLAAILFAGPWLLLLWIGYRLARRMWGSPAVVAATEPAVPEEPAKP